MKKIISFLLVCAYILGVLGALGYTLYSGAFLIAVCVVVVAWMAWPQFVEQFLKLTDNGDHT